MSNNHAQFIAFSEAITISKAKKDTLKGNRKTLRDKIRKYFKDNRPNDIKPNFTSQGSFAMKTIVNPIPEWSSEDNKNLLQYDIDDGVYFIGEEKDKKSINTYHSWIYDAVKDHTSKGAIDKTTCVRVLYADGHHIDLPIYFKIKGNDTIPQLAHKSKEWIDSDPKAFFDWFNEKAKNKEQLKRIVRYLKAWRDYRHTQNSNTQMPSGFILTILATNNISYNDRDDIALTETLNKIQQSIDPNNGGKFECYRPTIPTDEDLFENYSDTKQGYFLSQLDNFVKSANEAVEGSNPKKSCEKWQKHFGDRFSCATAIDEDEAKERAKAFAGGNLKYGATGLSTTVGTAMPANKGFYGDV
jgi:TusA-related sulfurtransferase